MKSDESIIQQKECIRQIGGWLSMQMQGKEVRQTKLVSAHLIPPRADGIWLRRCPKEFW